MSLVFAGEQTVVAQDVKTKKPVIIQVTEGHGTAVYTLVHLELVTDGEIAENQELDAPSLNHWTQSEDARMSILSQILQLLGLNCQRLNAPILTPVYLLSKKEVRTVLGTPVISYNYIIVTCIIHVIKS